MLYILTSHIVVTRRPVLQKVRHHTLNSAMSARKHRVSGSLSLPSRGSFHLSLTVLYSIGHMVVFSLRRWSSFLPSGFLVSRRTPDSCSRRSYLSSTGLLPSLTEFSNSLRLGLPFTFRKSLPDTYFYMSFGLFRFRSPLLSESLFYFLFLRVIRWFSSPGSPRTTIDSSYDNAILLALSSLIRISVITFVYVQLVTAFRSLSRPSSAPYTKASSLRSL